LSKIPESKKEAENMTMKRSYLFNKAIPATITNMMFRDIKEFY